MIKSSNDFEPGEAAEKVAAIAVSWLKRKTDIILSPSICTTDKLGQRESGPCLELTEALLYAAIRDISFGEEISPGMTLTRKVTLDGQPARIVLSPYVGIFGGAGPDIYYRWLPKPHCSEKKND